MRVIAVTDVDKITSIFQFEGFLQEDIQKFMEIDSNNFSFCDITFENNICIQNIPFYLEEFYDYNLSTIYDTSSNKRESRVAINNVYYSSFISENFVLAIIKYFRQQDDLNSGPYKVLIDDMEINYKKYVNENYIKNIVE